MLYIFNSGISQLYATNVLNTLFLPKKHINRYRYRISQNVTPELATKLQKRSWRKPVVIIFIDRYNPGKYIFHPLRLALLKFAEPQGDQLHIVAQMSDYVFPKDLGAFNKKLTEMLSAKGLPKLTNGDPKFSQDGQYVIEADSIFKEKEEYIIGDAAWTETFERIKDTDVLTSSKNDYFCFLKSTLNRNGWWKREVKPSYRNGHSVFKMLRNKDYDLLLTYKYPILRTDPRATAKLTVKSDEGILWRGNSEVSIDSHTNTVPVSFRVGKSLDSSSSKMTFSIAPAASVAPPPILHCTDAVFVYDISDTKFFWLQLIIALLASAACGTVIGADLSKFTDPSIYTIISSNWPKFGAALLQAILFLWLFRLIGKKVL